MRNGPTCFGVLVLALRRCTRPIALADSVVGCRGAGGPLTAEQRLAVWESWFDGLQLVADGQAPARMLGDETAGSPRRCRRLLRWSVLLWVHHQHIRDAVERPGLSSPEFLDPLLDTFMRERDA